MPRQEVHAPEVTNAAREERSPESRGLSALPGRMLGTELLRTWVTCTGTGGTWLGDLSLTRWRGDALQDEDGEFVFLRDLDSGEFWPIALRPGSGPPDHYDFEEGPGWVAVVREQAGLWTRLETWVDAERSAVCRRIVLHNRSGQERRLDLTTWHEIVLDRPEGFAAHPAFSKLFLQTSFDAGAELLLARRRPRAPAEAHPWLAHGLWGAGTLEYASDRVSWLGRGGHLGAPRALRSREPLSGIVGSVLDPALAVRRRFAVPPGDRAEFTSLLIAGPSRDRIIEMSRALRETDALEASRASAEHLERAAWKPLGPQVRATIAERWPAVVAQRPEPPRPSDSLISGRSAPEPLRCFNGLGGFSRDGREYVIRLRDANAPSLPPMPWVNVLAHERFGCLVSERGAISTWSRNSRTHRLTPWSNDPVCDPHDDALYLRDEEPGACWSPMPGPMPGPGAYEVRHGFGSTSFHHATDGLETFTRVFVPVDRPVRIVALTIMNRGPRSRRLAAYSYQKLVLGDRDANRSSVQTSFDARRRVLLARQEQPPAGIGGMAFASVLVEGAAHAISHTTDAMAFLGPGGNSARPAAVEQGVRLDSRTGAGLEPGFVWRVDLEIPPGETRRCAFVLGDCGDLDELDSLLADLRAPGAVERMAEEVRDHWAERVDRVQIQTPIEAIDLMVNGWLAYQTLTCRLWGRTAFYQSGGAFGFRDQLQDASAFLATDPDLVRRQILLHAAHQFPEGDVLHWWHPPLSQGIRTRFADDLLWLPEATANYVRVTGDRAVLGESVGFVTAPPLAPEADEAFVTPGHDPAATDLYDHCCRAIDRSLATGAHGLPYFGTGDWNDGMNRVGREGRGESVWMAFFLYFVLDSFTPLCETRADRARVARYREHQERLRAAIASAGWDGAWYRRGYYDDGSPLGSSSSDECRIDALVQAWSVLSGAAPRARAEQAMNSALRQLVSEPARIVKLLAPAFDRTPRDPGYIKGYVPGVRENGGQYTHAALWVVRALAQLGRIDEAASMLEMLSPVSHGRTPGEVATYQVEPYVVAADVYGEPPHVGRGGWTWYTGSAGWMFRVALESILGISVQAGQSLVVRPRLPSSWPAFSLNVKPLGGNTVYAINVQRDDTGQGEIRASLDQQPIPVQDGTVSVALGGMTLRRELRISIPTSARD